MVFKSNITALLIFASVFASGLCLPASAQTESETPPVKSPLDQALANLHASMETEIPEDLFTQSLKSYCVLMESKNAKLVKNPNRFSIVAYSTLSGEKRLFVYDLPTKSFIHELWTTHGAKSRISLFAKLGNDVVLKYSEPAASLFSNRPESNQSSVGMVVADTATYYSSVNDWTALRLSGIDGDLNSKIRSRYIVMHEFGFNEEQIRLSKRTPLSEGCIMLPKIDQYKGEENVELAKRVMADVYGSSMLLYHDRMNPEINEEQYQDQLSTYAALQESLDQTIRKLQEKYNWDEATTLEHIQTFQKSHLDELRSTIEETRAYFKTKSAYFNVEPKNQQACIKRLGL